MQDYERAAVIDGEAIYKDKDGFFLIEHYPSTNGSYYAIPVRLGKTA